MKRLSKKSDRLEIQTAQINQAIERGYTLEPYKGLKILTAMVEAKGGRIAAALKVYYNTAAKADIYKYYGSDQQRDEAIKNIKANYDRNEAYKLECKTNKQKSTAANCAAAIREELKTSFAGVKFSVTSENFSMGNSVNIKWIDGPTEDEVKTITGKYQYGHFNGMEDIYEYSNSREDIPQTKYVTESRNLSEANKATIEAAALEIWKGDDWDTKNHRQRQVRELFNNTSLPLGAVITGIQYNETNYKHFLTFEAPATTTEAASFEKVEVPAGQIQIVDYSEKAIAIIGETRPFAEKLGKKGLGLKFNKYLTCGPGWIAPKSRLEEITKVLQTKTQAPDPETIPEELTTEEAEQIEEAPTPQEIAAQETAREIAEYKEEQANQSLAIAANYDTDEDYKPQQPRQLQENNPNPEKFNYEFYTGLKTNYNPITGQTIEARRIASDQRKAGQSNTALPAPQMYLSF